jgi:hypothetical protein
MVRIGPTLLLALCAMSAPALGQGKSGSNASENGLENRNYPLKITIESGIDFSRSALRGQLDGDAQIDPQTGSKIMGPQMIDLGGMHFQGRATVTGKPLQPIRIDLPATVVMRTPGGARAELTDFQTDIDGIAMLDANGELSFRFGARISTIEGAGGDFRGRIPIRVDYF